MGQAQGKHADGGAFDYVVNGKMIGGFGGGFTVTLGLSEE